MLQKLYKLVTPWAISNKYQIQKNRLIGFIANIFYPFYCTLFPIKKKNAEIKNDKIIVSLTSFPARINKVHLCINSILRQSYKADKVILWLANSQFASKDQLPKQLLKLEEKGLEIRFCKDLKSYKKIFFVAQEFSNWTIITADDDTLYPEYWIENLLKTSKKYKDCIVCYRAHEIMIENNTISPYNKWNELSKNIKGPSMKLIAIGVGGILYPSNFFKDVKFDWNIVKENALTNDDIWLKILEVKKKFKVVKVNENSKEWFTIRNSQKDSLKKVNVETENRNDMAIKKLMLCYKLTYKDFIGKY